MPFLASTNSISRGLGRRGGLGPPEWLTPAGSLGTSFDSGRGSFTPTQPSATVSAGTLTYSLVSGSVPAGMTYNTGNSTITGTPNAVGSDTTSTFTLRATNLAGLSVDRTFTITVRSPVINAFNFTGAQQTFTVPSGISSSVPVWVWGAGGGTGGSQNGTYGGAAGHSSGTLSVSAGQTYRIIVGGGGNHVSTGRATGGFGGGGQSGNVPSSQQGGASGGGYSGVFFQNVAHANSRIIAGGGGGGAGNGNTGAYNGQNSSQYGFGGAGGGNSGQRAEGTYVPGNSGFGGTQNAGGGRNANTNNGSGNPTPGSALQGGTGGNFISSQNHSSGGGGGGGYYGGGGGRGGEGGITAGDSGGGGSGYIGGVTSATTQVGQGAGQYNPNSNTGRPAPPETGNARYPGANVGTGGPYRGSGGNGYVVITY